MRRTDSLYIMIKTKLNANVTLKEFISTKIVRRLS